MYFNIFQLSEFLHDKVCRVHAGGPQHHHLVGKFLGCRRLSEVLYPAFEYF